MRRRIGFVWSFLGLALAAPPGVVIDHWPASTGQYVGSPSIAILPNGQYVASHDLFGPKSTEFQSAITRVFASADKGRTWRHLTDIQGAFWSNLFVHRKALYLMGVNRHYGDLVIRRSRDGGRTWTEPRDEHTGLLAAGRYHTAPVPVVLHRGRLWRAFEDGLGPGGWGSLFRAFLLSAPERADLLERASWRFTNAIGRDPQWLEGKFGGWLEGNAVVTPQGGIANILRVDLPAGEEERAAVIEASPDGQSVRFDPASGFVSLPGAAKKFSIRYDRKTKCYWALSNPVLPAHRGPKPGTVRNALALQRSRDLRAWEQRAVVLYHPDTAKHAFQYVDWQFDGKDLIVAARTAFDDGAGGAHNNHDANYLTFHRVRDFRGLTSGAAVF